MFSQAIEVHLPLGPRQSTLLRRHPSKCRSEARCVACYLVINMICTKCSRPTENPKSYVLLKSLYKIFCHLHWEKVDFNRMNGPTQAFFGHFEKKLKPKKLKTQGKSWKNSSKIPKKLKNRQLQLSWAVAKLKENSIFRGKT